MISTQATESAPGVCKDRKGARGDGQCRVEVRPDD